MGRDLSRVGRSRHRIPGGPGSHRRRGHRRRSLPAGCPRHPQIRGDRVVVPFVGVRHRPPPCHRLAEGRPTSPADGRPRNAGARRRRRRGRGNGTRRCRSGDPTPRPSQRRPARCDRPSSNRRPLPRGDRGRHGKDRRGSEGPSAPRHSGHARRSGTRGGDAVSFRQNLTDAQVEAVIEGRNRNRDLASVSAVIDEIRALRNHALSQPPADLIAQAAAIARESRPTPAAAPRPVRRSTWRFAPALAGLALVFILMAPMAVFANSASPDDFLYPLDRLLERVGIGDGGLAERLTEAEILHERGDALGSAQHLSRSMEEAEEAEVSNHVERATALVASLNASGPDPETLEALDAVASMLTEQPGENPADPGNDNPNQGPGTNSGNDNPNQGPGNNSGNDNPNQGPGNNSGNDNPNQGPGNNSGNDNPNQGPGNNSGNGNPNPGQGSNASGQPTGPPPSGEPGPGDPGSDQGEDQPGESGENPNKGSGNNSGNDGESNPNKGPGNNSGKGKNRP